MLGNRTYFAERFAFQVGKLRNDFKVSDPILIREKASTIKENLAAMLNIGAEEGQARGKLRKNENIHTGEKEASDNNHNCYQQGPQNSKSISSKPSPCPILSFVGLRGISRIRRVFRSTGLFSKKWCLLRILIIYRSRRRSTHIQHLFCHTRTPMFL